MAGPYRDEAAASTALSSGLRRRQNAYCGGSRQARMRDVVLASGKNAKCAQFEGPRESASDSRARRSAKRSAASLQEPARALALGFGLPLAGLTLAAPSLAAGLGAVSAVAGLGAASAAAGFAVRSDLGGAGAFSAGGGAAFIVREGGLAGSGAACATTAETAGGATMRGAGKGGGAGGLTGAGFAALGAAWCEAGG